MRKILIIGIVASGKTTLARKLSNQINIPWFELDYIVRQVTEFGRYKRTPEEQVEAIIDIDNNGSWIFEGIYRESYHCLLDMADTIIFLDTPLWKRKIRIFLRFVKQITGIEKCHYNSNLKMLRMMYKWTHDFEVARSNFESMLRLYEHKLTILSDSKDLDFLNLH